MISFSISIHFTPDNQSITTFLTLGTQTIRQMKINKISLHIEDFDLTRPYEVAYVKHEAVQNYVLVIETDKHIGIGTGSPSEHVTGEIIPADSSHREDEISGLLLQQDIRSFKHLILKASQEFAKSPALLAAVDMALHDLFCRHIGVHISSYLGVNVKPLTTSITIGIKSLDETLAEGREYIERGFKAIKLKIGSDYESDLEKYLKLREATPSDIVIRVDANQGFATHQLKSFILATQDQPVEFFEQPFPKGDYELMRYLDTVVRSMCCADEDCQKMSDAAKLSIRPLPYGIFNIKLMKSGGITEAIRIADVALLNQIHLMWGCMDESCVSIAAALNTAYSCPQTRYIDLDGSFDLSKDIARGGFYIKDGILYPDLTNDGLSVELI